MPELTDDYRQIFLRGVPMLDLRAPVEFAQGAFPGAVNLPLMSDEERARVGTCYKQQGQDAAIKLGHQLVSGQLRAQRMAAWGDVARRIAHEIKNPLTPIQLSAERLKRKYRARIGEDVEIFDRCTDTIIRQVGDIGRMVDEFSSFARMPAPRFAPENPAEMLREAVFAQRVAAPDIVVDITEPLPKTTMEADGRMVGQALINILKNAGESVAAQRLAAGEAAASDHAGVIASLTVEDGVATEVKGDPERELFSRSSN